jgi:hypothetical protein
MNLSEVFQILLAVVFIVWMVAKMDTLSAKKQAKTVDGDTVPRETVRPAVAPSVPATTSTRRLDIAGMERLPLNNLGFLRGFAVRSEQVTALVRYVKPGKLESFPASIQDSLHRIFLDGGLKGLEVVGLLFRGDELQQGKAVYIAEVTPPGKESYLTGFVGKAV